MNFIILHHVLQDNYENIQPDKKLKDLEELIAKSEQLFCGIWKGKTYRIIELNDIRQKLFQPDLFDKISVKSIMKNPCSIVCRPGYA